MLQRNWKQAVDDFEAALRINPNYENARVNRNRVAERISNAAASISVNFWRSETDLAP